MKDRLKKFHDNLELKIEKLKEEETFLSKHNFHVESLSSIQERTRMKAHKYKAIKTVVDGITFDSKKEAEYFSKLRLLLRAIKISDLKMQVPFKWIEKHSHDGK